MCTDPEWIQTKIVMAYSSRQSVRGRCGGVLYIDAFSSACVPNTYVRTHARKHTRLQMRTRINSLTHPRTHKRPHVYAQSWSPAQTRTHLDPFVPVRVLARAHNLPTTDIIISTSWHCISVKNGRTSSRIIILSRVSISLCIQAKAFSFV